MTTKTESSLVFRLTKCPQMFTSVFLQLCTTLIYKIFTINPNHQDKNGVHLPVHFTDK